MVKPRRAPWGRVSRRLSSAVLALLLLATPASALTLTEIIELSKAGVSDEVLVALIEVDGTAWDLTPEQVVELTEAGISERVLLALIDSGRAAQPPAEQAPAPEPEPPVYDVPEVTIVPAPAEPAPLPEEPFYADAPGSSYVVEQYETFVPVPVFVDVPDTRRKHHERPPDSKDRSPDERRHARGRDDSRDDHSRDEDRPERRNEPPRERWARDLPRSGIPASEQPHYRDHSRDLGARDLRALKRAHLDESKDDGSSSGASSSSSDSASDRASSSKRRR
ncbi:MAG: hypothetical protein ACRD2X_20585 [Vicinamibacteraceae bacterium]